MNDHDTMDYITAFAIGTALGIGAALIARRKPKSRRERLAEELKPYRKKAKKNVKRARKDLGKRADATLDVGGEMVDAGRDMLYAFSEELGDIMADAKDEFADVIEDQLKDARKRVKKRASKIGK